MNIILDTSLSGVYCAAFYFQQNLRKTEDFIVLSSFCENNKRMAASKLPEILLKVIEQGKQNLKHGQFSGRIEDIENFYVGCGPGSFTGIRIGLAFVNGLNLPMGEQVNSLKRLHAVNVMAACYMQIRMQLPIDQSSLLLMPSTRTHAYGVLSREDSQYLTENSREFSLRAKREDDGVISCLLSLSDIELLHKRGLQPETTFLCQEWKNCLTSGIASQANVLTVQEIYQHLNKALTGMLTTEQHGIGVDELEAVYLRESTAEENLKSGFGSKPI